MEGHKFRRQHPISSFVLDFYCYEKKLCIEVDGDIHQLKENLESDKERTLVLESMEIKVIRFTNEEVQKKLDWVMKQIESHL